MTKINALLVSGLFILIVNLSVGEDGLLSRLAGRYRNHAAATPLPQAEGMEHMPSASSAAQAVPPPVIVRAAPEPVAPELLPERLAPRVEVLLAE